MIFFCFSNFAQWGICWLTREIIFLIFSWFQCLVGANNTCMGPLCKIWEARKIQNGPWNPPFSYFRWTKVEKWQCRRWCPIVKRCKNALMTKSRRGSWKTYAILHSAQNYAFTKTSKTCLSTIIITTTMKTIEIKTGWPHSQISAIILPELLACGLCVNVIINK